MKQFLVLSFLTGIIRKPEVRQYWSTSSVIKTPYFNDIKSQNRFQSIPKCFHFNDNRQYDVNNPNRDKLFKIRPVFEHLVMKFKGGYYPDREVSIDEELLLLKGCLGFKQYIPKKGSRFGRRIFSLCKISGYLWNTFINLGKETNISQEKQAIFNELEKWSGFAEIDVIVIW